MNDLELNRYLFKEKIFLTGDNSHIISNYIRFSKMRFPFLFPETAVPKSEFHFPY